MKIQQIIDEQMKKFENPSKKERMIRSLQQQHIWYKKCPRCGLIKEFSDYGLNKNELIGLHCTCLDCCRGVHTKYYSNDEYRKKTLEKHRLYNSTSERKKQRNNRKKELRKQNPMKYRAREALNYAIRSKKIAKGVCEVCGAIKTQAHHRDYTKPLEVMWLCQYHHIRIHEPKYLKLKEITNSLK